MSPAAAKPERTRCLVLGYDATENSRRATSWAVNDLLPDGRLVLVHADRSLHVPPSPLTTSGERARIGHAMFDELLLDGGHTLLDVDLTTEVTDEDPVSALIEAAERHDADAIVIGVEPHSRLRRVLGVVTDELLERSPVPVIAVPAGVKIRARGEGAPPGRARSRRARSG